MESFDSLVISLYDSEANKGLFKKELSKMLDIPMLCIGDVWLESEMVNTVVKQYLYVRVLDEVKKENLMKVPFSFICEGCLVFEVGDVIL